MLALISLAPLVLSSSGADSSTGSTLDFVKQLESKPQGGSTFLKKKYLQNCRFISIHSFNVQSLLLLHTWVQTGWNLSKLSWGEFKVTPWTNHTFIARRVFRRCEELKQGRTCTELHTRALSPSSCLYIIKVMDEFNLSRWHIFSMRMYALK